MVVGGCGGGRQQKYICAANLMRTFERLNPKERAAASALQPELRLAGLFHWSCSTREKI